MSVIHCLFRLTSPTIPAKDELVKRTTRLSSASLLYGRDCGSHTYPLDSVYACRSAWQHHHRARLGLSPSARVGPSVHVSLAHSDGAITQRAHPLGGTHLCVCPTAAADGEIEFIRRRRAIAKCDTKTPPAGGVWWPGLMMLPDLTGRMDRWLRQAHSSICLSSTGPTQTHARRQADQDG